VLERDEPARLQRALQRLQWPACGGRCLIEFGGAWWTLNLKANPDAEIQVRGIHRRMRGRVAEGDERDELWRRMNAQYGGFDDYRSRTAHHIDLFALELT
jgi:deazaflavin-dependent oxidoreductase (nitroreductase family)